MNSGKVRIYELSKELNLDNKDLLAVCEKLNIFVKSHSSTITDSEAEQIRVAAEKYIATHPSSSAKPRQGHSTHPMTESKTKVPPPTPKKQQILEIRKPPRQAAIQLESPTPPSDPGVATPPVGSSVAPAKPVLPNNRPTAQPSVVSAVVPTEEEAPVATDSAPKATEVLKEKPAPPVNKVAPPAELTEPSPQKGSSVAKSAPSATPKPSLVGRPVLKRSQEQVAPAEVGASTRAKAATGGPSKGDQYPARSGAPASKAPAKVGDRKPQTIVELRRPPSRPVTASASAATETQGVEEAGLETLPPPVLKLKRPQPTAAPGAAPGQASDLQLTRPTLPRSKKAKGRHDEEEEVVEFPEKAPSKVGPKGKRRTQPDVDEEEDLDILLEEGEEELDGESPVQVSLSLVRPAKPKSSRPPQPKPLAAAPKAKKFTGSRDRRERREEVKAQKPEKITLTGGITVQELAALLTVPETDIIRALFFKGIAATVTQTLDLATATMVAQEFEVEIETGTKEAEAKKVTEMLDAADLEHLQRRPPVVTIMGHVDHGKTTLLDSIRKTKVAQGEAGGITQHIGAYHVDVEHNGQIEQVVFLDTPGHEAFTAMRARGARVTDIAILVVAADDGVRPQTIEAIRHAQAAEVPILVAINKVDKEEAQPDRVKQELTEFGLVPEEWGGETIMVPVSALTGDNLDTLLEMILLVSEVEDLYANPDRPARGTVIEAHLDKAKGPVATLLIQNGTLRVGNTLVAGSVLGKVRALMDDRGVRVEEASPSFAVEVLGLNDVPAAGDEFEVFTDEKEARNVSSTRADEQRQSRLMAAMSSRRVSLNTLSARAQEGELKELNLVLKADVQGSVEAILGALKQLPQNEVQVRVLYAAPGEISETDVDLAAASDAVIIGFNTTLAPGARQAADRLGVDVRDYNIIYKLLDDIQAAMEGLLEPELVEESLGQAEVRAVFPVGRGSVAGCYVQSGKVLRNSKLRVRRGGEIIYEGNLDSLKRMKEDAREVNAGYECGIGVDNFNDWQENDIIESFRMVAKRRSLSGKV